MDGEMDAWKGIDMTNELAFLAGAGCVLGIWALFFVVKLIADVQMLKMVYEVKEGVRKSGRD